MSTQVPESITTISSFDSADNVETSLADVESIVRSDSGEIESVDHVQVVEKDGIMQVEVKPSGFAHYSLIAILKSGQRAVLYPMKTPDGEVVGLARLLESND